MNLALHPNLRVQKLNIGREGAPLLVIDELLADASDLLKVAVGKVFSEVSTYYPGIRAKVPLSYQSFIIENLSSLFCEYFRLPGRSPRFTACHFSLVTTPPNRLSHLQRIPHIDSTETNELAFVHYLFKADLGGTAFYRHRSTGFEFVDAERQARYFEQITLENEGADRPAVGYIHGDTPLYEQIGKQDGVFNRMLVYRRTSLHSASLGPQFKPDPNPRTGRLSVNGFIA